MSSLSAFQSLFRLGEPESFDLNDQTVVDDDSKDANADDDQIAFYEVFDPQTETPTDVIPALTLWRLRGRCG